MNAEASQNDVLLDVLDGLDGLDEGYCQSRHLIFGQSEELNGPSL